MAEDLTTVTAIRVDQKSDPIWIWRTVSCSERTEYNSPLMTCLQAVMLGFSSTLVTVRALSKSRNTYRAEDLETVTAIRVNQKSDPIWIRRTGSGSERSAGNKTPLLTCLRAVMLGIGSTLAVGQSTSGSNKSAHKNRKNWILEKKVTLDMKTESESELRKFFEKFIISFILFSFYNSLILVISNFQ